MMLRNSEELCGIISFGERLQNEPESIPWKRWCKMGQNLPLMGWRPRCFFNKKLFKLIYIHCLKLYI